ncbi:MAG: 50S ribosomal protein L32 [Candidatus Daviesbacteria bacterium]|nr:50S ribosomal protein L32 [Candidatus Daviesbacteria bacterium]
MAGEPKRRHSKSRKRVRRASISLAQSYVACKNCGKPTLPHIVCGSCGFYNGQKVRGEKAQVTKA